MMVLVGFLVQWMMPLFFILSAMSSAFVLSRRSTGRYLGDRVKRLLVPFLLGTFVVLIPVQVWIERVTHGDYDGGFWSFYPHYFDGWYAFGGNFAWMGLHLWYLQMLFLFSVLTVPLFRILLKATSVLTSLSRLASWPGGILLLSLPLILCEWYVNQFRETIGMRDFGGWSLLSYLVFFLLGFVLATDDAWRKAGERHRHLALAVGALLIGPEVSWAWAKTGYFDNYLVSNISHALNAWCWLVAILGYASRHLTQTNRFLQYGNEAVLPFYVLHQTIIGEEALLQLAKVGETPDVLVGCTGGGSNFGGLSFPFLREKLAGRMNPTIRCVEPASCPSLTRGEYRYDFGDTGQLTPLVKMHTLGHTFVPDPIHAGGLRYHGMAPLVSHIYELGLIEAESIHQTECFAAAIQFAKSEGIVPAPEPTHAIAAAIREALRCKESGEEKVILTALCGHGHLDLASYEQYLAGQLVDYDYPEEKIAAAMEQVPVLG